MKKTETARMPQYFLPVSIEFRASPEIQKLRNVLVADEEKLRNTEARIHDKAKRGNRIPREVEVDRMIAKIEKNVRVIEYADAMWKLGKTWRLEHPKKYPSDSDVDEIKSRVIKRRSQQRIAKSSQSLR